VPIERCQRKQGGLRSEREAGAAWDDSAKKWQMQEFMQTQFQFTAGNVDAHGAVLAVNLHRRHLLLPGT
jgi:hypothetical protein